MRRLFSTRRLVAASLSAAVALASTAHVPMVDAQGLVQQASSDVADAAEPSISEDGRWVVFTGRVGDRTSVFRTDLELDTTTEISPVPPSVRAGDTIHPRLSPDGCVVVAITEIPYDLFRDDDRDERWDVYRLLVPECGGQPNSWELVSLSSRTGTAIDGVFTDSAPALSGSGSQIAFVHQAAGASDGVGTITIVDVSVPTSAPGRESTVAGVPVEAPNRAYVYAGFRQPVLSQNGRHLAFVADATASEALPGWAGGPVPGEQATSQVYVWDRLAADQRRAVHLVSSRNGVPTSAGASSPVMSEDGRIIVFTSRDRTLVPAALPTCVPECPIQIYRYDRDTDGNGIFDEPPRRDPLEIVSAVDAGVVEVGVPRAGNASSWAPAVNADGSQIAFVSDATNLLPSRRAGGGGAGDGDLVVAEFELGQLRRVLDGADATDVPGAHGRPALSKTGETIVFETMAGASIDGLRRVTTGGMRQIVTVSATPQLSLASLDFGTVLRGFESTELYVRVLNSGPAAFEPTNVMVTSNFKITGGTCSRGVLVAAGTSCSVNLTFNPTAARGYEGTLTVGGDGPNSPSVSATVRGAAGEPTLLADPGGVDLEPAVVGEVGGRVAIDIDNIGFTPTSIANIRLGGTHPDDFVVLDQSCTNRALNPDASCTIEVEFRPRGVGYRSGLLLVSAPSGQYTAAVLGGFARYEPTFETTAETTDEPARAGRPLGLGGAGFPPDTTVAIGFDDGSPPFATVETNSGGGFLAIVNLPSRLRVGERRLVATAKDGAVANVTIDVLGSVSRLNPAVPGYGF
ncbi:MAG: choice-of-anchor D domain-containing protein [Ilumatobacteraceae bacterium]|nr:choice-of-anchor D domain-containing protein [Ilumatobacteraceae bacterium]